MKNCFLFLCLLFALLVQGQDTSTTASSSLVQLSVAYGPQYDNFVDYDRDLVVVDGFIQPLEGFPGEDALLQKREIGTYFNATLSLRLGGRNYLELGHSRTLNQGVYNGVVNFPNGTLVTITDFQLRHRNHYYKLGYKRVLSDRFAFQIGLVYLRDQREVINVFPAAGYVQIAEHNYEVSNSEEGGVYAGISYDIFKSGRFTLGANASAYVLLSLGELETISLAPYLRFNF